MSNDHEEELAFNQVQEEIVESFCDQLCNSFCGACVGMVLFLGCLVLAAWNEYRNVATLQSLNDARDAFVEAPCSPIDPAKDGQLVHVTCDISNLRVLGDIDPVLQGIPAEQRVGMQLTSELSVYQWVELVSTSIREDESGNQVKVTTYSYDRQWLAQTPADIFNDFQDQGNVCRQQENGQPCINWDPTQAESWWYSSGYQLGTQIIDQSEQIQAGDFILPNDVLSGIGRSKRLTPACGGGGEMEDSPWSDEPGDGHSTAIHNETIAQFNTSLAISNIFTHNENATAHPTVDTTNMVNATNNVTDSTNMTISDDNNVTTAPIEDEDVATAPTDDDNSGPKNLWQGPDNSSGSNDSPLVISRVWAKVGWALDGLMFEYENGQRGGVVLNDDESVDINVDWETYDADAKGEWYVVDNPTAARSRLLQENVTIASSINRLVQVSGFHTNDIGQRYLAHTLELLFESGQTILLEAENDNLKGEYFSYSIDDYRIVGMDFFPDKLVFYYYTNPRINGLDGTYVPATTEQLNNTALQSSDYWETIPATGDNLDVPIPCVIEDRCIRSIELEDKALPCLFHAKQAGQMNMTHFDTISGESLTGESISVTQNLLCFDSVPEPPLPNGQLWSDGGDGLFLGPGLYNTHDTQVRYYCEWIPTDRPQHGFQFCFYDTETDSEEVLPDDAVTEEEATTSPTLYMTEDTSNTTLPDTDVETLPPTTPAPTDTVTDTLPPMTVAPTAGTGTASVSRPEDRPGLGEVAERPSARNLQDAEVFSCAPGYAILRDGQIRWQQNDSNNLPIDYLKRSYSIVNATKISIMAQQRGDSFVLWESPYDEDYGLYLFLNGEFSPTQMLDQEETNNEALTWTLRVLTLILSVVGLVLITGPLHKFPEIIPCCGSCISDVVGGALCCISSLIGFACWALVAGIAYAAYRPAIGIPLLICSAVLGVCLCGGAAYRSRRAQSNEVVQGDEEAGKLVHDNPHAFNVETEEEEDIAEQREAQL